MSENQALESNEQENPEKFVAYIRSNARGVIDGSVPTVAAQEACVERHVEATGGSLLVSYFDTEIILATGRPGLESALEACREHDATLLIPAARDVTAADDPDFRALADGDIVYRFLDRR